MSNLRVLVIDDCGRKRMRICDALRAAFQRHDLNLTEAADYEEALASLTNKYYDLVILDILIPAAGGPPSEDISRALIHQILKGTLTAPMHIIGLTAFHEVGTQEQRFYDENLFALEFYSETSDEWAGRLIGKVTYLLRSKNAALAFQYASFDLDLLILTARFENEFMPIKKHLLPRIESTTHPLWRDQIAFGEIAISGNRTLRTAIACIGEMGMAAASSAATSAMNVFRPRLISMLGMCCGFDTIKCATPQKLLDIIVARQVSCWEEGRFAENSLDDAQFLNRAKPRQVDDRIRPQVEQLIERSSTIFAPPLRRLQNTARFREMKAALGQRTRTEPIVSFGTMVSGSSVIALESKILEIIDSHPSAIGLDMELFGIYTAVDRALGIKPSVLGIKCVADFGTKDKDKLAQKFASIQSAEVLRQLLGNLDIF